MNFVFYLAAAVAVFATLKVITGTNAVHALLYLIVSLLSVALIFFVMGAPFVAALEVIIYAGAIMVIFLFVIMMLNLGGEAEARERQWLNSRMWIGPGILSAILLALLAYAIFRGGPYNTAVAVVDPKQVGIFLFGPYLLAVQLAAMLLMSGLVGASHLRRREYQMEMKEDHV